jgi:hypothetical protein
MNLRKSKTAKFVAGFVGFTMALTFAFAPVSGDVARAQTPEQLQHEIQQLLALIATMQAQLQGQTGGTVPSTACTFTRNLGMGMSGADVTCLQNFLIAGGFSIPAGATGYFGAQTAAAVQQWQASRGISPTAPAFGPQSRAAYTAQVGTTPPGTTPPTTPPMTGEEGTLVVQRMASPPNSVKVEEGQTRDVFAFEVEAKDSAMTINRIDLNFNRRPWLGMSEVSLRAGNTELASVPGSAGNFTEMTAGSDYRWRVTGLNHVVPAGTKQVFTVSASARSVVANNNKGNYTVTLGSDAIRSTDSAGIVHFEGMTSNNSRTFNIAGAEDGTLEVSSSNNNPSERIVQISANSTTNATLLRFNVEADDSDVRIKTVTVNLDVATPGGAAIADAADVMDVVELFHGNTLLDSVNPGTSTASFTDLDVLVNDGSTVELTVRATLRGHNVGTGYNEGTMVSADVAAGGITGEDAQFTTVTSTGSATGETQHLYERAPQVTYVSSSISHVTDTQSKQAQGSIVFDVTAVGGAIFINSESATNPIGIVADSNTGATTTWTFSTNATKITGTEIYRIDNGQTRRFTVDFHFFGTGAFARAEIGDINWGLSSSNTALNNRTLPAGVLEPLRTNSIHVAAQ